jgi:hypothetical protein
LVDATPSEKHAVFSQSSALKMETKYFSKTLAPTNVSTWCQDPENHHHHHGRFESTEGGKAE